MATRGVTTEEKLVEPCTKKDSPERLRNLTEETLQRLKLEQADIVIWTDGSVGEHQMNGGSGAKLEIRENGREDFAPASSQR